MAGDMNHQLNIDKGNDDCKRNRGWVKWVIIGGGIVLAAFFIILFFTSKQKSNPVLMPAEIEKITIYREGTVGTTFSYTDAEKINTLINYFTALKLKSTTRTPYGSEKFVGGEWQIRIQGKEGICGMKIAGNEYFQHPDGTWWNISAEQATEFEELLKSIPPDELPETKIFDEWK